jgi:hypothetical protein
VVVWVLTGVMQSGIPYRSPSRGCNSEIEAECFIARGCRRERMKNGTCASSGPLKQVVVQANGETNEEWPGEQRARSRRVARSRVGI